MSRLALALPDQDQAERGQHRAISGPLDLPDHETRLRPVDRAGALADPEQTEGEGKKANDQKRVAHRVFLVARCTRGPSRKRSPDWRTRADGARYLLGNVVPPLRRHKKA